MSHRERSPLISIVPLELLSPAPPPLVCSLSSERSFHISIKTRQLRSLQKASCWRYKRTRPFCMRNLHPRRRGREIREPPVRNTPLPVARRKRTLAKFITVTEFRERERKRERERERGREREDRNERNSTLLLVHRFRRVLCRRCVLLSLPYGYDWNFCAVGVS